MDTAQEIIASDDRSPLITMQMDLESASHVVDLVREYLGRELDWTHSEVDGVTSIIFSLEKSNDRPLSFPDWRAAETLAKYFRDHAPGLPIVAATMI